MGTGVTTRYRVECLWLLLLHRSPDSSSEEDTVIVDPEEFCMNNAKVLSVCPLLEKTLREVRPDSIVPEKILHSL